jgi:hypothetical protein
MKNKLTYLLMALTAAICMGGIFTACSDEIAQDNVPYLFRPINFNASLNGVIATIGWAKVDSAVTYTVQISQDSLTFKNIIATYTTNKLSYSIELAGSTRYSARVKANASDTTKNSKYNATLTFLTPAENIFKGYGTNLGTGQIASAYMTAQNSLDIKWMPGANATHLILTSATGVRDSVAISAGEATSGAKTISQLSNSTYTIQIYNGKRLRGTTTGLVEGDLFPTSGAELATDIANATDGQVIVLAPSTVYAIGTATVRFAHSVKIRGMQPTNRPVICMASGSISTSSATFGFVAGSTMDYVKFENIDFTGYADNSTSGIKIGYLFNNNTLTTVGTLSFSNCLLHNFGNTPMRLQAGTTQRISLLSFLGCTIYEIGYNGTYAVVNVNSADYFDNISFNNCTVYNFKNSFILRTGAYTMASVSITNCNFNQGVQDQSSVRPFIDLNSMTLNAGITISNCIFGSTGVNAAGVRKGATTSTTITGCYYTTDNIDATQIATVSYSIQSNMAAYAGTSAALWTNPANGNFTIKDASFAGKGVAGDLRW